MSKTPVRQSSCACGRVQCRAAGAPIVAAVCYCDDCQEAARRIEALANAPRFCDPDGGTPLLIYRDDRFECASGESLLVGHKLKESSPTRRMVASCCNSAMFLIYAPGFWVSAYRARFDDAGLPPAQLRIFIEHRRGGGPPPGDAPAFRGLPKRLYARFALTRVRMLLGL